MLDLFHVFISISTEATGYFLSSCVSVSELRCTCHFQTTILSKQGVFAISCHAGGNGTATLGRRACFLTQLVQLDIESSQAGRARPQSQHARTRTFLTLKHVLRKWTIAEDVQQLDNQTHVRSICRPGSSHIYSSYFPILLPRALVLLWTSFRCQPFACVSFTRSLWEPFWRRRLATPPMLCKAGP